MNHHKGNLHSRLACFAHPTSSSSSSSSPFSNLNPPLTAASPSGPFPFDHCVSLLKLQAQAAQRQRPLTLRNFPPLSPQDSSTPSFSDSASSSPLQRVEPHRFLQSELCVQSHHQGVASFFSNGDSSSSSASAFGTPLLTHKNYNKDVLFSDLPIVRGPVAFQTPPQSKAAHRMDGDGRASEDSKRLKLTLEDLERELLADDPDIATSSFLSGVATSSALDAELPVAGVEAEPTAERDWTDVIEDLLSAESSSHTTTVDHSTITSISSKPSMSHKAPPSHGAANPRELLLACASAINNQDYTFAKTNLSSLEQSVSTYGDPMQRLAAYMAEGLAARMELMKDGHGPRMSKMVRKPSPTDVLKGTQVLYHWCPYFKFGYMAANGAIAEAFRNEPSIHIIDFDIGQGNQWQTLIGAFSQRPGGPPHVRITGVADPKAPTSLEGVGRRLQEVARRAMLPFEFKALQMEASHVEPWMLDRKAGEALAVNFAFHLHRIPDESVSTSNPRDSLLRKVKTMQPKIVTLVEHDANINTAPFYPRFVETLNYFNAVFESLDVPLPRDSKERVNAEQHCLARDIMNIVACEGAERLERYEVAGKWRARMTMAGFRSLPLSSYINRTIKELLQPYSPNYKLREESGALHLDWFDRGLVAASAWQ